MDRFLFQDVPLENREEYLEANAESVDEIGYVKQFTQDELDVFKDELAEKSIAINDIEIEKKEVVAEYKRQIDPLQKVVTTNLKRIKEKGEYVKEPCYKFINQKEGMALWYNKQGVLVHSRPINPSERQGRIFPLKTGTEN